MYLAQIMHTMHGCLPGNDQMGGGIDARVYRIEPQLERIRCWVCVWFRFWRVVQTEAPVRYYRFGSCKYSVCHVSIVHFTRTDLSLHVCLFPYLFLPYLFFCCHDISFIVSSFTLPSLSFCCVRSRIRRAVRSCREVCEQTNYAMWFFKCRFALYVFLNV